MPIEWKGWISKIDHRFKWEARRIFPTVGYPTRSNASKVCSIWRRQAEKWRAVLRQLDMTPEQHMGSSEKSARHLAKHEDVAEEDVAEEEYWFTTQGLIAILLFWLKYQRGKELRTNAIARCFMLSCVHEEHARDFDLFGTEEEVFLLCDVGVDDNNPRCLCLDACHRAYEGIAREAPQARLWEGCRLLWEHGSCGSCRALLQFALRAAANSIDDGCARWGNTNLAKAKCIVLKNANGKRMRTDSHLKGIVVADALKNGLAPTASSYASAVEVAADTTASDWIEEALAGLHAAARLSFPVPRTICVRVRGQDFSWGDGNATEGVRKTFGKGAAGLPDETVWAALLTRPLLFYRSCLRNVF